MIEIESPQLRYDGDDAILETNVSIDGNKKTLWFKVDQKYGSYLCYERGDAYLVACLHYAIFNGHDIKLNVPVSEQLLFKIRTFLIPAILENNPDSHEPQIFAKTASGSLPNAGAIGTGISCGVDSFHALASHTNTEYCNLNITHLAFNNVGSHGIGKEGHKLYEKRIELPRKFAKAHGFEFVCSDSNLMDVIQESHFETHTYSSMFAVLCLQKLYRVYFYASGGYKFNEFNLVHSGKSCSGAYELLSLPAFSTDSCAIFSDGMGKTRLRKMAEIVKYEPSFKYLNVCLNDEKNCGKCEKCVRTLLGLDILNALDKYSNVFDIKYYRNNRRWYLQQLLYRIKDGKHDYFEMYPYFKKDITIGMKFNGFIYSIIQRIKGFIRKSDSIYNLAKQLKANHAGKKQ